jgi:ankyrin repeat protein
MKMTSNEATLLRAQSYIRHNKIDDLVSLLEDNNSSPCQFNIDMRDEHGNTMLHTGACANNKRAIKALLRRGANPNIQNLGGNTPLHICFLFGHDLLGHYLIAKGADDGILNSDKETCYEHGRRN